MMSPPSMPTITVLVPTYRRAADLGRCLAALSRQTRPPDEVIVITRVSDEETPRLLAGIDREALCLRTVLVAGPGQVTALNAGIAAAQGDIVSITDDDAAPHPDWLARIEAHFRSDPRIGGVGGRDWVHRDGEVLDGQCREVGRVQWFGRLIGNHHLGVGPARRVEVLKGANMSYRRTAIRDLRFDTRLRGEGAQVHNDLAFSLSVHRAGWTLIYDPAVAVDHHQAPRRDMDTNSRGVFHAASHRNGVYNETLVMMNYLSPPRRAAYVLWLACVGTKVEPGLGLLAWLIVRRTPDAVARFAATAQGRLEGLCASAFGPRLARRLQ